MLSLGRHLFRREAQQVFLQEGVKAFARCAQSRVQSTQAQSPPPGRRSRLSPWVVYPTALLTLCGVTVFAYESNQPFRHTTLAAVRCSRVASACGQFNVRATLLMSLTSVSCRGGHPGGCRLQGHVREKL